MLIIVLVLLLSLTFSVYADGEGPENSLRQNTGLAGGAYEVTGFSMHDVVGQDHTYEVEEEISVNIPQTLQKIEFAVPSGSFRMRGLTVESAAYTSKISSSGSSVTIVDQQALTTGIHTYTIIYKIYFVNIFLYFFT